MSEGSAFSGGTTPPVAPNPDPVDGVTQESLGGAFGDDNIQLTPVETPQSGETEGSRGSSFAPNNNVEATPEDSGISGEADFRGGAFEGNANLDTRTVSGDRGPRGEQGPQGIQGDTGQQGPAGQTGAEGPRGNPGQQGNPGNTGPIGPSGPRGLPGEKGNDGDIGPTGPRGNDGPTGPRGLPGDRGNPGPASTVPGPTGPRGLPGDQGPDGATGPTGPMGNPGADGDTITSVNFNDASRDLTIVTNRETLRTNIPGGSGGSAVTIGVQFHIDANVPSGNTFELQTTGDQELPLNQEDIVVALDGVVLVNGTDYTYVTPNISFTRNLVAGSVLEVWTVANRALSTHSVKTIRFEGVVTPTRHTEDVTFSGGPSGTADFLRVIYNDINGVAFETINFSIRPNADVTTTAFIDNIIADANALVNPALPQTFQINADLIGTIRPNNISDSVLRNSNGVILNNGDEWSDIATIRMNTGANPGPNDTLIGSFALLYDTTRFGIPGQWGLYRVTSLQLVRRINANSRLHDVGLEHIASVGVITFDSTGDMQMVVSFNADRTELVTSDAQNIPVNFSITRNGNALRLQVVNNGNASFDIDYLPSPQTPPNPVVITTTLIVRGAAEGDLTGTLQLDGNVINIMVGERDDEIARATADHNTNVRFIGTVRGVHENTDDATTVLSAINPGAIAVPILTEADGTRMIPENTPNTTAVPGITITVDDTLGTR